MTAPKPPTPQGISLLLRTAGYVKSMTAGASAPGHGDGLPGCEDHRHVRVARGDGTTVWAYSDSVAVLAEDGTKPLNSDVQARGGQ